MIFSINKKKHQNFIKNFYDDNKIHKKGNFDYFGNRKKVVHGINTLLYALEKLSRKKILDLRYASVIEVLFHNPIFVDEKIEIIIQKSKNLLIINLNSNLKKKCEIKVFFSSFKLVKINDNIKKTLSNATKKKIKKNFSTYKNFINLKHLRSFNSIEKTLGFERIISIISLSYLIGKIYPGDNSLFLSCRIKFNDSFLMDNEYKILKKDKRFNISLINFSGCGLTAELKAHHIREKLNELDIILSNLKRVKLIKKYKKKFLILGGSSGIGLALTGLILKSGGLVTSTYYKNKSNLDNLNKKFKKKVTKKNFNIKRDYLKTNIIKKYDYIIYMITPKIFISKKKNWSEKLFRNFLRFYVNYPLKIFKNINSKQILFLPSSVALYRNNSDLKEYSAAKKIMEEKFTEKKLTKNIKILRLEEVENNQTIGNFLTQKKNLNEISRNIIKKIIN